MASPLIGFKRHLRPEIVVGDAVYLFSERGVTALEGEGVESLAPLLDGTRDMPTLLREASAQQITEDQVAGLIDRLTEAGLVSAHPVSPPGGDAQAYNYWEAHGLDPSRALADVTTPVRVTAVGDVDLAGALAGLTAAGLRLARENEHAGLSIVLCDDYLAPGLAEIDAAQRTQGRPWLLARLRGERVWIGPFFDPAEVDQPGPCWHCLAYRLWGHRPAEAHVQARLGTRRPVPRPVTTLPAVTGTAVHLVALEAVKWLAGCRYPGQRTVWTLDTVELTGRHHEVHRRPQCPSCGDPTLMLAQARRPVRLTSIRVVSRGGGGHRALRSEEVIERYRHLVSPVSGVIKELLRDTRSPTSLNAYLSGPCTLPDVACLEGLRQSQQVQNGGKGLTQADAQASALCEALERHSAVFQGDEEVISAPYRSLMDTAIHPDTFQLYHPEQLRNRHEWNVTHPSAFQFVCAPFDEDAVTDWTPVWSLTEQRHRLMPTAALYFGAPGPPGEPSVRADSNGNAAGATLEDAVLQGVLELVERDAVALWWYNRTSQPDVDLDSFGEGWIDDYRQAYADLHRELWVLDLTSDLGLPVMAAISRRVDKPREDILLGFGAHLDPRIALRRAVTEMNQLLPSTIELKVDSDYEADEDLLKWWRDATVENQPYLAADRSVSPTRPADHGYESCDDLLSDVEAIHGRLRDAGLSMLVLDQTRPDIGLPVAKVIVPGLRHFWARLAPGRLYDVPVQLGRLIAPTRYESLNPIPLFM